MIIGRATDNDRKTIRRQLAKLVTDSMALKSDGQAQRSWVGGGSLVRLTASSVEPNVKTSEPLDIDWTARLDRTTGQHSDGQRAIHPCQHEWTAIGHGQRQATGHPRPSIRAGVLSFVGGHVDDGLLVVGDQGPAGFSFSELLAGSPGRHISFSMKM